MVENIPSYHKIQHVIITEGKVGVADRSITDIFNGPVEIEEKTDGSQFRAHISEDGKVTCGSRNENFEAVGVNKMFTLGVESMKRAAARLGTGVSLDIFAEYLAKPAHNTLEYERVPKNNLMLFDVQLAGKEWASRDLKAEYAEMMDIDVVPLLWKGDGKDVTPELLSELLKTPSYLGKAIIEGVVIKNYTKFYDLDKFSTMQGKFLCGKMVRAEFKEANRSGWSTKKGSTIQQLAESLRTEARFAKAVQHLKERGELTNTMKDIRPLIDEIFKDIEAEEGERLKEIIWKYAWGEIKGGVVHGFPEWYKGELAKQNPITS